MCLLATYYTIIITTESVRVLIFIAIFALDARFTYSVCIFRGFCVNPAKEFIDKYRIFTKHIQTKIKRNTLTEVVIIW